MINTEQEFHLLSELIDMDDRHLAQRASLLIWDWNGRVRDGYLRFLVNLCKDSKTRIEFHEKLPSAILELEQSLGVKAVESTAESHVPCKMPGKTIMKHIDIKL